MISMSSNEIISLFHLKSAKNICLTLHKIEFFRDSEHKSRKSSLNIKIDSISYSND
jgi:hypothetical protein